MSSYWIEREEEKQARMDKVTDEQVELFKELLLESISDLDVKIQKLYMKYAKDNDLDYHAALQYLTDDEREEFQKDLTWYLEKAQNEQDRIQFKQELQALSVRHRVKRIEMLKANIQKHASILHDHLNNKSRSALSSLYTEGFLRGIYESVQGEAPNDDIPLAEAVNPKYTNEMLSTPWSGKNYSDKIWDLTADFEKKLSETLTQDLVQGKHPNEMARDFRKLGVGKDGTGGIVHRAETLMQTEAAYIIEQATLKGYEVTGIEKYEFMNAKDSRVCNVCASYNKERIPCDKATVGSNYPPMHPRCRCTTVPVTPYSDEDSNEQYVYETDYEEWYETYCAAEVEDAYAEWAKENKEESEFKMNKRLSSGGRSIYEDEEIQVYKRGRLTDNDNEIKLKVLKAYEKTIVKEDVEHAVVIAKNGDVFEVVGKKMNVYPNVLGKEKLDGAYVTHNHPDDVTEYTLSNEDVDFFEEYNLSILRGVDCLYEYELDREYIGSNVDSDAEDWMNENNQNALHAQTCDNCDVKQLRYRRVRK